MTHVKQYRIPTAALLLFVSGHALSASCGALSPRLLELGDDYYEPTPLVDSVADTADEQPLRSTLEPLLKAPFHQGSGERVICLGTGDRARSVTALFELKDIQRRSLLNGEHLLSAVEHVHTTMANDNDRIDNARVARHRKLSVPPMQAWRIDSSGQGFSSVIAIRHMNASNATYLQEQVWLALPTANGLVLELRDYTNGVHAGSVIWRLRHS